MTAVLPGRRRPAVAVMRWLTVAGLGLFALLLMFGGEGWSVQSTWLSIVVVLASGLLCLTRASLDLRRERAAWLCMGVGLACYAGGNITYQLWVAKLDPVPFPSVSDALFLAFYPCAYSTLVLLVRRRVLSFHSSLWLDGVVGGLGAAAIGAALAFQTIMDATGGAPAAAVATNLAYPIADLLLLVLVVGVMALMGWHPGRAWWLLASGFVLFAVVDTLYLFRVAEGTYQYGSWFELLWPGAAVIIGLAAWSSPRAEQPLRLQGWTILVFPSLFAVSSLGVLLLADLDRFKEINDAFGHEIGDQLLRLVGPRLAEALGPRDVLVRLGGDEFAVLVRDADSHRAAEVASRLLDTLEDPFTLEGVGLHVDASIGIACYPDHAAEATTLLQRADVAMYQAKSARNGWHLYEAAPASYGRGRLQTIEDLRAALTDDQLVLHYQPKIDAAGGQVVGIEALVRWQHPTEGLLYPDSFLPLAEQTRLMRSLTSVVLQSALEQVAAWRQEGIDLSVAVNLSVANLLDVHLPVEVARLLAAFGLPATALEVEITESTLMVDPVRSKEVLDALRGLGVRIAVDDYGTGYSSLAYLRELAVDELKLDKSFVIPMLEDSGAAAIVQSTVELAHALGLRMVAEGVESEAHLRELARLGCDVAQGYHISRPVTAEQLGVWLRSSDRAVLAGDGAAGQATTTQPATPPL